MEEQTTTTPQEQNEVTSTSEEVTKEVQEDVQAEQPKKDLNKVKVEKKSDSHKYQSSLGKYMVKNDVSKTVLEIVYWHHVYRSAGIFGGIMFLLLSLYCYPFLTVLTNFCLALLAVAFLYRIGMTIVNAIQKTSPEHPFQKLLERDIKVPTDRIDSLSKCIAKEINCSIKCLQDLFLVKDVFASIKFGVILWLLSYVASWVSPLTILTLSVLLAFTIPKLYEEKYVQIDDAIKSVSVAVGAVMETIKKKLPASVLKFLNMSEEKKNN